jgi:hypothetical protein
MSSKELITCILRNPAAVDAAIIILANNQTAGELRSKSTHNLNGEGFSAAYGRVGTRFYEFVTGIQMSTGQKKWPARSLSHPKANVVFKRYIGTKHATVVDYARHIAELHWKQLSELSNMNFDVPAIVDEPTVQEIESEDNEPATVTVAVFFERTTPKAIKVRLSGTNRVLWLPKSLTTTGTGTVTIPTWLAKKEGLA